MPHKAIVLALATELGKVATRTSKDLMNLCDFLGLAYGLELSLQRQI
jgi:hypothetical protein